MRDAVIVDVVRTPSGKGKAGGMLSGIHPIDLLASTLIGLVKRTGIHPGIVEDVIGGCVTQTGQQGANVTRSAVLAAGFPFTVPGTTVDRQCGSSQQALHFAAHAVQAGAADVVIACGVESMSRAPMFSNLIDADVEASGLGRRFPEGIVQQGLSAEMVCARWGLSREELDDFAYRSHQRAGEFADLHASSMVLPFSPDDTTVTPVDETVRASSPREKLDGLQPAFRTDEAVARFPELGWRVTAGNSSPLTDGAAAALVMEASVAERLGLKPRARVHSTAVVGDDPILMLMGVVPATAAVLRRAGLSIDDIDAFEVNEAFACVPVAWQRETGVPGEKLNVLGAAIALGHPLGATGVRVLGTLLSALDHVSGRYGLQTICEAGGMANATIVERLR